MSMVSTIVVALPLLFPHDNGNRPTGGPSTGVTCVLYDRCFESGSMGLRGARYCSDGDRAWLLFTTRIPDDSASFVPPTLRMLGPAFRDTLPWTWLVEIDKKGDLVGTPKQVRPPTDAIYDVSDLGAVCLGCYHRDGKLICLNPDGAVVVVPTQAGKDKSSVTCRLVSSLDPAKMAAEFCKEPERVALHALRLDSKGNPEVCLEVQPKRGQRLFVRKALKWDDLLGGRFVPGEPKVPAYHYLGEVSDGQKLSAVYDRETDELLLVKASPFEVVRRVNFMEKKHRDSLKEGVEDRYRRERRFAEVLAEILKEPLDPSLPMEISTYGKVDQRERITLALSGLFKAVELNGKVYCLYVEMDEGKLLFRPYAKGEMGKAISIPVRGRTIDYQVAVAGKHLIVLTAEAEVRESGGGKLGDVGKCFFHSYRFDGVAWKQLPDWCDTATQKLTRAGYKPEMFDMIPIYQPVVLGGKVFVYYVAKKQPKDTPKVCKFELRE